MPAAPPPANEPARLAALRAYRLLDTAPENDFDDITRLASAICRTPISLVVLLDGDRQWFKSRVGLDAPETPREQAFCAHAILRDGTLVVEDAAADARFADNALVTGAPHIRFYAGAPLVDAGGHALGTLCVIDRVPRRLDAVQLQALETLGRQVTAQMELRRVSANLADALESVRELAGLLPVCAWCKCVRDDGGYWRRVEDFLAAHTDVRPTHAMCPACQREQLAAIPAG